MAGHRPSFWGHSTYRRGLPRSRGGRRTSPAMDRCANGEGGGYMSGFPLRRARSSLGGHDRQRHRTSCTTLQRTPLLSLICACGPKAAQKSEGEGDIYEYDYIFQAVRHDRPCGTTINVRLRDLGAPSVGAVTPKRWPMAEFYI